MKASPLFALALAALACAPSMGQQAGVDAGDSAKTTYAPAAAGFGDDSASRSWEMAHVWGDLDGKLDSKTAKVGDRVSLKTSDKVQAEDGTVIPRGSHIVGHITAVQAHDNDRAIAQIAIAFDHVEMKNGQSIAVHSLIRTVRPSGSVSSMNSMDDGDMMSANPMGGSRMGGGRNGGVVGGGGLGASGNATTEAGGLGAGSVGGIAGGGIGRNGTVDGAGAGVGANPGVGNAGAGVGANQNGEVQLAGHGDAPIQGGAHAAAAARAVPHYTGIPGVMLAGSSAASGLLINADRRDLQFENGTRFEMGVVADR